MGRIERGKGNGNAMAKNIKREQKET